MTKFSEKEMQESLKEAPEWLRDALAAQRVSPGFRECCREAAMVAYSMAAMRKTRAQSGLVPEPWERYVNGLASRSEVKIEPVIRWLGVKNMACPEPADGRAYAKLGKALGMTPKDIEGHIIVSLRVADRPVLPLGLNIPNNAPATIAGVLAQMEAELTPAAKQKLQLIRAEIKKEYDTGSYHTSP